VDLSVLLSGMAIGAVVFANGRMGIAGVVVSNILRTWTARLATFGGCHSDVVAGRSVVHAFVGPDFFSSSRTLPREERYRIKHPSVGH